MLVLKALILQFYWFLIVVYSKSLSPLLLSILTFFFLTINYYLFTERKSVVRYLLVILIFTIVGYIHDSGLMKLHIIQKESYHYSYLLLWSIFVAYYSDIFKKLERRLVLQIVIGALGGFFAYYSALDLKAWKITDGVLRYYILYTLVFWAIFFPASFVIYKKIINVHKYKSKLK